MGFFNQGNAVLKQCLFYLGHINLNDGFADCQCVGDCFLRNIVTLQKQQSDDGVNTLLAADGHTVFIALHILFEFLRCRDFQIVAEAPLQMDAKAVSLTILHQIFDIIADGSGRYLQLSGEMLQTAILICMHELFQYSFFSHLAVSSFPMVGIAGAYVKALSACMVSISKVSKNKKINYFTRNMKNLSTNWKSAEKKR